MKFNSQNQEHCMLLAELLISLLEQLGFQSNLFGKTDFTFKVSPGKEILVLTSIVRFGDLRTGIKGFRVTNPGSLRVSTHIPGESKVSQEWQVKRCGTFEGILQRVVDQDRRGKEKLRLSGASSKERLLGMSSL